jgi:hypothetical protein
LRFLPHLKERRKTLDPKEDRTKRRKAEGGDGSGEVGLDDELFDLT